MSDFITKTVIKYEQKYGDIMQWESDILVKFQQEAGLEKKFIHYNSPFQEIGFENTKKIKKDLKENINKIISYKHYGEVFNNYNIDSKMHYKLVSSNELIVNDYKYLELCSMINNNDSLEELRKAGYNDSDLKRFLKIMNPNYYHSGYLFYSSINNNYIYSVSRGIFIKQLNVAGYPLTKDKLEYSLKKRYGVFTNHGVIKKISLMRTVYFVDNNGIIEHILPGKIKIKED